MRDLGFLVADKNIEACLHGLLEREDWHLSIGCAPVDVALDDVKVAAGQNDPGLYTRGADLLSPFSKRYRRMVVMLDSEWDGSPGPEGIEAQIKGHLSAAGWSHGTSLAVVLTPEVDVWLWTRTDHTARALGWARWSALQAPLATEGWWVAEQPKPNRPKEAAEWALRKVRKPRSSFVYKQLARTVGLGRCTDAAFITLRDTLRAWFPAMVEG